MKADSLVSPFLAFLDDMELKRCQLMYFNKESRPCLYAAFGLQGLVIAALCVRFCKLH